MTGHRFFCRIFSAYLVTLLLLSATHASPAHLCAADATARAAKLLALHVDGDERAAVNAKSLRTLTPVRNPANSKQKFDVIAVTGYVYKAEFRMRFLYAQKSDDCVLIGQEILEFTGL